MGRATSFAVGARGASARTLAPQVTRPANDGSPLAFGAPADVVRREEAMLRRLGATEHEVRRHLEQLEAHATRT